MKAFASIRVITSIMVSAVLLATACVSRVRAQDLDNVNITGRVFDQNGAIIPGATIELILMKTGATRTSVTDDAGS